MERIYITTTLPYINDEPHLGHSLEYIQADVLTRLYKEEGREVFLNTGTDEHGTKVYRSAKERGIDTKEYADELSQKFKNLLESISVRPSRFIRTTDEDHIKTAKEFWTECFNNGFIYKKKYKGLYCVGCELFKKQEDLKDGFCTLHPNKELEEIEEENYFFKFSSFQDDLLKLYDKEKDFIYPSNRFKELKEFVKRGLEDFSISRESSRLPWGIEVPNDKSQTMFVWFDALINYLTTIGWPDKKYDEWWPPIQIAGKDNIRQQGAMFQAMLMSLKIKPSKKIFIHGFLTRDGKKMSKTIGNIINPTDIIDYYGGDFLRYFLLMNTKSYEDSDITIDRIHSSYISDFSNDIGNLVSRLMRLYSSCDMSVQKDKVYEIPKEWSESVKILDYQSAMRTLRGKINELNTRITKEKPFIVIKEDKEKGEEIICSMVSDLIMINKILKIVIPDTSEKISQLIDKKEFPKDPLFPKKEKDKYMIDVHSHIQIKAFDNIRDELIKDMKDKGMTSIVVGIGEDTSKSASLLADIHSHLYATCGIHPLEDKGNIKNLIPLMKNKKVVAVGECGLDYTRTDDIESDKRKQQERLWEHIEEAKNNNLPLMIHIRTSPDDLKTKKDAHSDLISIMKEAKRSIKNTPHFHLHFYTEKMYAEEFLSLGATFSFSGVITFVKEYEDVVRMLPKEVILSETDSPYASPHPNRGKKNTPLNVLHIVEKLSELKDVSSEEMNDTIEKNFNRIFIEGKRLI